MSQTFTDDCFAASHEAQTDMANIENNFAALKSAFSGTSQPSNVVPGMRWFDTTKKLLKLRNQADSGWLGLMNGDANTKIWIYANAAADGWVVDSSVTDRVLAIKGGSNAYNVSGGVVAGTWTQPSHALIEAELPAHSHVIGNDSHTHTFTRYSHIEYGGTAGAASEATGSSAGTVTTDSGSHNHTCGNTGSGSSHNHGTTHRPAAAVGTLQYLDL